MAKYILSQRAEQDLRLIWRTIAANNESAADGLVRRILNKASLAADHPHMGSLRPELSPTARLLIEGRYITIYEPMPYGIFVVAIVHGSRDIESWLE
ncbi:type II toxin-antitoxin system RelE/ParE family toxin [Peteryoungia ipomoeae]|uniref:Type II toxin-antitoxin system RelE/ParE family toxin n=1 Tax=Peteryoungia ipomoeae TaxID=1210932 RepID=A0A4S8NZC3_9HYPH|nr:type II toxin-antitoxin system RelE/ParE family toxin [Peteryoungia ipomoeae]THV23103.1 type II toxin-antitoxin system RelE/ParE family toxin [Peteryoungia ipomoeae]